MRIFVSSRIDELPMERKTAVEAIHFAGHTPLFIETERFVTGEAAKRTMDSLIADADGFVLVYYISLGKLQPTLDRLAPIQYELDTFLRRHPGLPCLILEKKRDDFINISPHLNHWIEDEVKPLISKNIKNISTASFTTPVELHKAILEWARKLGHDNNAPKNVSRFIFRYTGPDYVGLIAKISEVVFGLSLNIDYISHAARSGLSTIYMSCSTYAARKDEGAFRRHLEKVVHKAIKKDLAVAKAEGRDFAKTGKEHVSISVDPDHEPSLPYQFYVELRTIDTPGQLHFICKVIRDTIKYNIDEIVLKPTQREHERQTTMSFWLSKRDSIGSGHPSHELMELELQLRALIGVQSLTTELIYQSARNQT